MDSTRAPYKAPTLASNGDLVAVTKRIKPPPSTDVNLTGRLNTEGSIGFSI